MNKVGQFLLVGVAVILAVKFFGLQQQITERVIGGVKTRDPEQLVLAAAITVGLGMVTVIAAQALKKL
jgi:hypothetical protein